MANNSVPDSWDDNSAQEDVPKQLSALSFNPDAPAFVPGKNVHAASFVPSGATQLPGNTSTTQNTVESEDTPVSANDGKPG